MKARFFTIALVAALLAPQAVFARDATWETLGPRKQQEADAAINAFLDQQLLALRTKLEATPCRLSVLKTGSIEDRYYYSDQPQPPPKNCGEYWTEREQQFWQRWRSGVIDDKNRNAVREAVAWPGNFDRMKALLEEKLQPLQRRDIRPYTPYGWYENVPGAEYLLRDGRTILGISRDTVYRDGGKRFRTHVQFSVFDVRSLPGPGRSFTHYRTYGRGNTADNFDTSATLSARFDPTAHRALATWGDRYEPGRKVDTRLLDPARSGQVQIAPELAQLGRELAERRWERLAFVTDTVAQMARQQKDRARVAERANAAWYRREMARSQARWARDGADSIPETNAWAVGAIDGIRNAASTQMFWNARAAEAQARHFQAQRGGGKGRPDGGGRRHASPASPAPATTPAPQQAASQQATLQVASKPASPAPAPPSEPRRVTVQRTADGNSHALLKKDELGPGQEQEACAAAREQANLNHALDGEEKASIQFGACGGCKPTQWVFGAPNGSSWKMTCTVDYTVDVKESPPSGGSSSSR